MGNYNKLNRLESFQDGVILFLLCWVVYFASYIGRYNYSAVLSAILLDGSLSHQAAGAVSTAYFIAYALGQLVNGFLCAKVSPYKMIFVGLLCSGGLNLLMGLAPPWLMLPAWALNGFFQSSVWPPLVRLFSEAMPLEQQGKACINIASTIPAGTLASYAVSAAVLMLAHWSAVFLVCGVVLVAFSLLWWLLTARLRAKTFCGEAEQIGGGELDGEKSCEAGPQAKKLPLLRLLCVSGIIGLIIPVMLHGAIKDGVTSWIPAFVGDLFGTSPSFSAAVSMVLPVINLSGAYAAAWLCGRVFKNEVTTSAALFLLSSLSILGIVFVMDKSLTLTMLLLSITTSAMLGINTMFTGVVPIKAGRRGNAAAISGILNSVTYLGAGAASYIIGFTMSLFSFKIVVLGWFVTTALGFLLLLWPAGVWQRFNSEQ